MSTKGDGLFEGLWFCYRGQWHLTHRFDPFLLLLKYEFRNKQLKDKEGRRDKIRGIGIGGGEMGGVGVRGRGCPGPEGFERHKELRIPEDSPPSAHPAFITGLIKLTRQLVM